jgi:hypothetical protein
MHSKFDALDRGLHDPPTGRSAALDIIVIVFQLGLVVPFAGGQHNSCLPSWKQHAHGSGSSDHTLG